MTKGIRNIIMTGLAAVFATNAAATEWDVSLWGKRRAFTEHLEKISELVSTKTNGEFTLTLHYGGLASPRENLAGIREGKFEMAQFCAGYHPDKNRSITVLELPYLGVSSIAKEIEVSKAVYAHPATVAELAQWNATLLMPTPQPQQNLAGVGKPPKNLFGLRNQTMRAVGGTAEAVHVLKSDAVTIAAPNVAEALNNEIVQAVAFAPHAHMAFGVADVATWWTTNLNLGTTNCPVVVNSDALASLSPEHLEALMSSIDPALEHFEANYNGPTMAAWALMREQRGITDVTFSPAALTVLQDAATKTAFSDWVETANSHGLPGQELLNLVQGIIARGD